ncbi:MAG: PhoX family phosphatase [Parvibaculum sp.]
MTKRPSFAQDLESADNATVSRPTSPSLRDVWQMRLSRRAVLSGLGTTGLMLGASTSLMALAACDDKQKDETAKSAPAGTSSFTFEEIAHGVDETHHVAPGYVASILMRWGDPVVASAPAFDPMNQSAAAQRLQFGYNNDYVGFVPLPFGSDASDRGLLCINHEYTNDDLMFPGLEGKELKDALTLEQVEISMAAHGGSVIEIAKGADGKWAHALESPYNRRITTLDTQMGLSGPAAGHPRLQTVEDPTGTKVIGTVNNCAGGITPWGTYLMAEENVNMYFMGAAEEGPEKASMERMGIPANKYPWGKYHKRFDVNAEPHECNRFGWIVEVDVLDPTSVPIKRTALGRFKHEGAETTQSADGRLVIYMGDDQSNEYLYKYVSTDKVNKTDRSANQTLLDEGTLYVATFMPDGTGVWRALIHGENGLDATNGFADQGDVLIDARRAGDVLGATPLDRPEDVQPDPITGKVYLALTNNDERTADKLDAVNTRAENLWGQIVEITPQDNDHANLNFAWDMLVQCGNPADTATKAGWNAATSANGWFANPDNLAVDAKGRLWVATDQGSKWSKNTQSADGIFALETSGALRGTGRMFFRVPVGAEMCGPCFTPDSKTFFVAVQHPAADGTKNFPGFEAESSFEKPATRWPDFSPAMPPRPSLVVITAENGGIIGG